jgi:hypothetical protein
MADITNQLQAAAGATGVETDPNFKQTVLLLHGDGTNGAQNNTFLDGSTNNFTITRNGNTTQGTFSPFSLPNGQWSNFFDGTGDYLSFANNSAFDITQGNFCVEMWVYRAAGGAEQYLCSQRTGNPSVGWEWRINATNLMQFFYVAGSSITSVATIPTNAWTHLAVTRSDTTVRLFINGAVDNTATVANGTTSTVSLFIGYGTTGGGYFNGYMSNCRLVKGSAVYTSAFTPSTTPLTNITNTSLLTCQSNRFVDNSTNAFAITRNGDVRVTPFSPFAPTAAYSASVNGGSGYFDGTGDYLTAPSSNDWVFAGDWTIEGWVYIPTLSSDMSPYATTAQFGNDQFTITSTGQFFWAGQGTPAGSCRAGEWLHLVSTRSGTTVRNFINGVLKLHATGISSSIGSNLTAYIGRRADASFPNYVNGYIGAIRIIKGSIPTTYQTSSSTVDAVIFTPPTSTLTTTSQGATSGDVKLLCNFTNAGIFDNTGKNNLETVGDAQIDTGTKKYGTGSMEFDGTGDYLVAPSNSELILSGDFTIECWAYRSASGNYRLFTLGDSVGTSGIEIYVSPGAGDSWVVYSNNATRITGASATRQVWTHLAVVRSGSTVTLYVNGTASGSTWSSSATFSGRFFVGAEFYNNTVTADTNGFIDDLRITKGIARYTANFTPPAAPFADQ